MEQTNEQKKNKGGRPPKSVKRNRVVALKCASYEQTMISARAKKTGLTVSEYLREMGLNGQIVITERVLPREVLSLAGTLNHMAANLNQIAKKRNSVVDVLNAADRASLEFLSRELKQLVVSIKIYLQ
ncbi:MAG: mobilization protein [Bacteroidota bacterium]